MRFEAELHRTVKESVDNAGGALTTPQLLCCLLSFADVRAAVGAVGASPPILESAARRAREAGVADEAHDRRFLELALAHAFGRVPEDNLVGALDVLIALAEQNGCAGANVLADYGISPLALKLHVLHGAASEDIPNETRGPLRRLWARLRGAAASPARVQVLVHNDPFTTREFVVGLLEQHFGVGHDEAVALTERIDVEGIGRAAELPYADAVRLVEKVTRLARNAGHPWA